MVGREIPAELLQIAHLPAEIEFAHQCLAELPHHGDRLIPLQILLPLGERGEIGEDAQIAANCGFDVGMLHLDDDRFAVGQLGTVNLPDGCRGHRHAIEFEKALGDRPPQFLLDGRDHDFWRIGGRAALQAR